MGEVHQIKHELQTLHYIYSEVPRNTNKDVVNYAHMAQIRALQQEVQMAQTKLTQFQRQLGTSQQNEGQQQQQLKKENEELLSINEQLVVSNDKFRSLFDRERA